MSNKNQHGGSRPVVREDDQRRNNIPVAAGPGRIPTKVTLRLGDVHYTHVRTKEGRSAGPTMMLEVTKVDRECVEFTDRHTGQVYHLTRG